MLRIPALRGLKCACKCLSGQTSYFCVGQVINSTCQFAMVLYSLNTIIIPPVVIALGSVAYFCSVFEIMVGRLLAREHQLGRDNIVHGEPGTRG